MDLMSKSLLLVGVCSFLFHATLRQTLQFSDDLSMLFLCAALLQRLYCSRQSASSAVKTTTLIYTTLAIMSGLYIRSGDVRVHFYMFSAMLYAIWPRTLYLIYWADRPTKEKSRLLGKFGRAVVYLVVGFVIWNIDLEMCQQLRSLREYVGLPWAWLFEFHGWWHVLTAVGAAIYMELVRDIC